MSYDLSIGKEDFNITYNVRYIFIETQEKGIRAIYGLSGSEAHPIIQEWYIHTMKNYVELTKRQPENGWGTVKGTLAFLTELAIACIENPDEYWSGD